MVEPDPVPGCPHETRSVGHGRLIETVVCGAYFSEVEGYLLRTPEAGGIEGGPWPSRRQTGREESVDNHVSRAR